MHDRNSPEMSVLPSYAITSVSVSNFYTDDANGFKRQTFYGRGQDLMNRASCVVVAYR